MGNTAQRAWQVLAGLLAVVVGLPREGLADEGGLAKIRDNLFLLEEAYNQEPGVIQHIQVFQLEPRTKAWSYSFTEEVPVPTDRHQLSVTVPVFDPGEGASTALGDVLVNYRLQALGMGGVGWAALAPRLSLVLPSGDHEQGTGRGVLGLQLNVPVSFDLGDFFTLHLNAGLTVTPGARSPGGHAETALDANAGLALVWLPWTWGNALVEVAWTSIETVVDRGSERTETLYVNPGLRFAIDVPGGLQIVPGIGAPIRFEGGEIDVMALGYLSFEHVAWE